MPRCGLPSTGGETETCHEKRNIRPRIKYLHKMTRDGLVEVNAATGQEIRVSKRDADFRCGGRRPERAQPSPRASDKPINSAGDSRAGRPDRGAKTAGHFGGFQSASGTDCPAVTAPEYRNIRKNRCQPKAPYPMPQFPGLPIPCVPGTSGARQSIQGAKLTTGEIRVCGQASTDSSDLPIPLKPQLPQNRKKRLYQKFYKESHFKLNTIVQPTTRRPRARRLHWAGSICAEEQAPSGKKLRKPGKIGADRPQRRKRRGKRFFQRRKNVRQAGI